MNRTDRGAYRSKQDCERCEALLAVNYIGHGTRFRLNQHYAAEKIRRNLFNRTCIPFHKAAQIIEKLASLLRRPRIRPLIARNGEHVIVTKDFSERLFVS